MSAGSLRLMDNLPLNGSYGQCHTSTFTSQNISQYLFEVGEPRSIFFLKLLGNKSGESGGEGGGRFKTHERLTSRKVHCPPCTMAVGSSSLPDV